MILVLPLMIGLMQVKGQSAITTKINITKLTAYEKDQKLVIEWSADAGNESNYWEVQGSADGKNYTVVSYVLGPDPGKTGEQYTFKGKVKRTTDIYYRVVHIGLTGNDQQMSNTVQLAK